MISPPSSRWNRTWSDERLAQLRALESQRSTGWERAGFALTLIIVTLLACAFVIAVRGAMGG